MTTDKIVLERCDPMDNLMRTVVRFSRNDGQLALELAAEIREVRAGENFGQWVEIRDRSITLNGGEIVGLVQFLADALAGKLDAKHGARKQSRSKTMTRAKTKR